MWDDVEEHGLFPLSGHTMEVATEQLTRGGRGGGWEWGWGWGWGWGEGWRECGGSATGGGERRRVREGEMLLRGSSRIAISRITSTLVFFSPL